MTKGELHRPALVDYKTLPLPMHYFGYLWNIWKNTFFGGDLLICKEWEPLNILQKPLAEFGIFLPLTLIEHYNWILKEGYQF